MVGDATSYLITVFNLFWHLLVLSLLATGGASSTLSDIHRFLVSTRHCMTSEQLNTMYVVSWTAPDPNMSFVELFGW